MCLEGGLKCPSEWQTADREKQQLHYNDCKMSSLSLSLNSVRLQRVGQRLLVKEVTFAASLFHDDSTDWRETHFFFQETNK